MATILDENLNFVMLIEDNKNILEKSQAPSAKKKKEEACIEFVEKWAKLSGKQLNHAALLKKVNNLKTRAKSDHNKGKVLTLWQTKILELTKEKDDEANSETLKATTILQEIEVRGDGGSGESSSSAIQGGNESDQLKSKSQAFASKYESEETIFLSNEELQRIVLLQQIKIQDLKQKKLELQIAGSKNPILFDMSALNVSNMSNVFNADL